MMLQIFVNIFCAKKEKRNTVFQEHFPWFMSGGGEWDIVYDLIGWTKDRILC